MAKEIPDGLLRQAFLEADRNVKSGDKAAEGRAAETVKRYTRSTAQVAMQSAKVEEELTRLCGYALTCEISNTSLWMIGLVERINSACEVLGDSDRFVFQDDKIRRVSCGLQGG